VRSWVRRHPLALFVAIAYALTWGLLPLAHRYTLVGILALLCPAAAAAITAWLGGDDEAGALLARLTRWRVSPRWYAVALLLPLPISLLSTALQSVMGAPGSIAPAPVTWLGAIVFVMVLGEEIGWRGFALPMLLRRFGPLASSVAVGVIWAVWHLPLFFMMGMPQYGSPFPAYVLYTVALSIILTALATQTAGSVIIATLFHGAVNTFIFVSLGATAGQIGWGNAVAYGIVAILIVSLGWLRSPDHTMTAQGR
jgi:membrane protease YdiL (CAAX protease family)